METKQRGRPRSFDRKAALQQATLAFWAQGYEATSIADLTRVMGIGAPSLYAAFGDKRALFAEVVETYGATYGTFGAQVMDEEPTARRGVARLLHEAAWEYTDPSHPPGCLVISAGENCTSTQVVDALREQRIQNVREFQRRIQVDVTAGVLPAHADAGVLARYTGVVVQGMSHQARDGASRAELEAVAELAMRAWPEEVAGT
ncbi:TetR/AcrR family transcriptional regulator [Streptomyces sp. A5-4]|uniref:TetR/AcrR family transcriptional regulator n=1 Tax=Streptomyces sp. A5-4 TaxID=3384771 RepID=UPI003DA89E48